MINPNCTICETEKWSVTCWSCGGEGGRHDCMDDCCGCMDPEANQACDICNGNGEYFVCPSCHPESFDD
jgi:hypothetical protein